LASYNVFLGYESGYLFNGPSGNAFNTFVGVQSGYHVSTGTKNTIIGGFGGNSGGLDIRTSSNNIVLSDGDGTPYWHMDNDYHLQRKAYGGGNNYDFYLSRGASTGIYRFTLSSTTGSNNSFLAFLRIVNNRYTGGTGISEWLIQADNAGGGAAPTYSAINSTIAGSQSFSVAYVSASTNTLVFDITLNDSYSQLFIEASAWAYGQSSCTLSYVQI